MTWGIIAALDTELELIVKSMEIERRQTIYGVQFCIGKIGRSDVVAVCCSIGTINAAACASVLAREFGAGALINIGVAGSACDEMDILDVILSSEVVFHDADTEILGRYYPFRASFEADQKLIALAEKSIAQMQNRTFNYRVGRVATGDVFVSDPALKNDIVARLNPLCVEMEGAAIGQIAYMSGLPFFVIRSLSDDSGSGARISFESFLEKAAKNSAGIVLKMIELSEK